MTRLIVFIIFTLFVLDQTLGDGPVNYLKYITLFTAFGALTLIDLNYKVHRND